MKKNDFISLCFISFVVGFLLSCFMNSRKQSSYEGFRQGTYTGRVSGRPSSSDGDFENIEDIPSGPTGLKFTAIVSDDNKVTDIRISGDDGGALDRWKSTCSLVWCPAFNSAWAGRSAARNQNLLWGTPGIDLNGGEQTISITGGTLTATPSSTDDTSFSLSLDINAKYMGVGGSMTGIIINFS